MSWKLRRGVSGEGGPVGRPGIGWTGVELKGNEFTRLIIGSLTVNNQVRDLEPLKGMKLNELRLYHCQAQDLEPLKDMPLTSLNLWGCAKVKDLTPLQGMNLTEIYLNPLTKAWTCFAR